MVVKHPIHELIKRKLMNTLKDCLVLIIHRGAPNDEKLIDGASITQVKKSGFFYREAGKEVFIPAHRIKEVRSKSRHNQPNSRNRR